MGKGKKQKIGYWYSFGIHMGLGRGPIDELIEIEVGTKLAWYGSLTESTNFTIDKPKLFGGEKSEGGIDGSARLMMGEDTQLAPSGLQSMYTSLGLLTPGFRGMATFYFNGKVCALNPYPKTWKFRVRRALKGWSGGTAWYPEKCVIVMDRNPFTMDEIEDEWVDYTDGKYKAMNAAHVLVECLTNPDWGRGLDMGQLNLTTYVAAADTLYSEGFGLCFRWTRQDTITSFIQTVLDHIGGVQQINRTTGLLELKLIRDDYVVADLPTFTYGTGLLSVEDVETPSQDSSTNQIIVKFHDPFDDEDKCTTPVDNLGAIQTNGTISEVKEYLAIPTYELAGRVALRDLAAVSGTLRKMTLTFDRRAYGIEPGDVFVITATDFGIASMVMRAGEVKDGTLTEGTITITAVQDVFGLPATSYVVPTPTGFVTPNRTARDPTVKLMKEANYRDLLLNLDAGQLQSVANTSAYVKGFALKPLGLALGYEFWTDAYGVSYAERGSGDWVPSCTIGAALPATGTSVTVAVANFDDFSDFEVGAACCIDDEEMIIEALDANNSTLTLGRGAIDTIPAAHVSGSYLWMYSDAQAFDSHEWTANSNIYGKFLTYTSQETLALASASSVYVATTARQARPYPPGAVMVNGNYYWNVTSVSSEIALSWAHRSRTDQDDQLFNHNYGSIGPETGVTYTITVKDGNGSTVRTVTGITGTSWSYTSDMAAADGSLTSLIFELKSVRDALDSYQKYSIAITRSGLGLDLGQYLGGSAA